jgi:Uma2 family endonuclease
MQTTQYTLAEYQTLCAPIKDVRLEYHRGAILAIPGARPNHNKIVANLTIEVGQRLKGIPCWVAPNDTRVYIEREGLMTFPDLVVICEEEQMYDAITVLNPTGLVEVLSSYTEAYDRTVKLPAYRSIPSVKQVLLVAQDEIKVESYPDGNVYRTGEMIPFLDLLIPIDDIYLKVKW